MVQTIKSMPAVWETQVQSLGPEDPLEKGKATHGLENSMDYIVHGVTELDMNEIMYVFSLVKFSCSVVSDSLRPHESQHARPPCPSPIPGVHSDSRPSSQ